MLIHVVCFKYKPEVSAADRDSHRAQLKALADIEGVVSLQVGADIVQSARSYDTGLVLTFHDRAALDAYAQHPRHVPVVQFGVSLSQHVVAVDFLT